MFFMMPYFEVEQQDEADVYRAFSIAVSRLYIIAFHCVVNGLTYCLKVQDGSWCCP
jgi:hypothetical protein